MFVSDNILELAVISNDLLVGKVVLGRQINHEKSSVRLETTGEGPSDGVEVGDMMVGLRALLKETRVSSTQKRGGAMKRLTSTTSKSSPSSSSSASRSSSR